MSEPIISSHPFYAYCKEALGEIEKQGRYRRFTPLSRQSMHYPVYDRKINAKEETPIIAWSANDYLGMGIEPEVMNAAIMAIQKYGAGAGGTRNIAGTHPLHEALEAELADLHGKEAGLLFVSGYVSNQASLQTILTSMSGNWMTFSDQQNHNSMIAGIKGAKNADCVVFKHNDLQDLEHKLANAPKNVAKLIAFESVYSMDGDIADIGSICALAHKYNALTYLDEVHAVGLYGKEGGGVSQRDGVANQVDIIEGTLAKGFGVHGGYVTAKREIIEYLRLAAAGFIFTTSLPPSVVAAALKSVRLVRQQNWRREKLFERIHTFQEKLRQANIPFIETKSQIVPVIIGEAELCKKISQRLLDEYKIYAPPINYPTVPKGTERLRLTPNPYHTDKMMDDMVDALKALLPKK